MLLTATSQNELSMTVMWPLYTVYTGYTVIYLYIFKLHKQKSLDHVLSFNRTMMYISIPPSQGSQLVMLFGSPSRGEHLLTFWQPCCSCGDGPNTFRPSNHPEQTNEINNKLRVTSHI